MEFFKRSNTNKIKTFIFGIILLCTLFLLISCGKNNENATASAVAQTKESVTTSVKPTAPTKTTKRRFQRKILIML